MKKILPLSGGMYIYSSTGEFHFPDDIKPIFKPFDSLPAKKDFKLDGSSSLILFFLLPLILVGEKSIVGGKEKKGFYSVLVGDDEYQDNLNAVKHCPVNIIKIEKIK